MSAPAASTTALCATVAPTLEATEQLHDNADAAALPPAPATNAELDVDAPAPPRSPEPPSANAQDIECASEHMREYFHGHFGDTSALERIRSSVQERDDLRVERDALQVRCRLLEEEVQHLRGIIGVKFAYIENWMNGFDTMLEALRDEQAAAINSRLRS
ncbi:hypothetical protein AURDEDRAFT_163508 [Auricularia subglabra TFB-10046 SS5]|nr:hypothetical protein AURDEDRAFT_163508 [Auricularia subglabra TFB-10046 SS5]